MSRVLDLGKNFERLPDVLDEFESELDGVEKSIAIEGKRLEAANREQSVWLHYYDQKRIELHTLVKYMELQVSKVRGKLFRSYTEAHQRELSDRAKDKYIDNEQSYLDMYEIYLEIKELYDKYQSVVDAFQQRGYSLNNITKIRVASLEDVEL